jgi:hypothetical protein
MLSKDTIRFIEQNTAHMNRRVDAIHAPEDPEVRALCERVGYGAVMDSAFRQWEIKLRAAGMWGGAHCPVACLGTLMDKPADEAGG